MNGKGFNEKLCNDALTNINTHYKELMGSVDGYQTSGIEVLCQYWISNKGKEFIEGLVNNINSMLDQIDNALPQIFAIVNEEASIVARDGDGIAYTPVYFTSVGARFSAANAKNDKEAGDVAQWDANETKKGIDNVERFLENRVRKNMDEIETEMYNIKAAFGYSEEAAAISAHIGRVANGIEHMVSEIEKITANISDRYAEDAAAHNVNVEEMTSANTEISGLDFSVTDF